MVTGSRKLPSPIPISTLSESLPMLVVIRSAMRSPFRSPVTTLDGFVEIKKVGGLVGFAPRAPGPYQQEETGRKTQAHVARTVHKPTILRSRHRWRNPTACVLRRP